MRCVVCVGLVFSMCVLFVSCCVMLYGVSLFVLFVCVFVCLCVFGLRVMYGAMVYGLYLIVVLVCVVDKSVGVICV